MRATILSHRIIRTLILIAFVWFIVQNHQASGMSYYIAPRLQPWVDFLAVGMLVLALHQMYLMIRDRTVIQTAHPASCQCGTHQHDHWKPSAVIMYSAIVLPLVLAFSFPHTVMGSKMAAQKGVNLSPADVLMKTTLRFVDPKLPKDESLQASKGTAFAFNTYTKPYAEQASKLYKDPLIVIDDAWYIESLTSMDMYQDQFVGKKVQISGFVYRLGDMGANEFALGKFAIRCCVGDSLPLGIMVETKGSKPWKEDSYVTVLGTIEKQQVNSKAVLVIKARTIVAQPAPENPYVYGNPYFSA